jgi:hypothetical protein
MNKQMILGTIRHFLTLVSGAVLAGKAASLETAIPDLANKIAAGDIGTIVSAVLVVGSLLWSMWVKAADETKKGVVTTLTLGMK